MNQVNAGCDHARRREDGKGKREKKEGFIHTKPGGRGKITGFPKSHRNDVCVCACIIYV
jgi:hypothetical protein